jgi:hypothetical protein
MSVVEETQFTNTYVEVIIIGITKIRAVFLCFLCGKKPELVCAETGELYIRNESFRHLSFVLYIRTVMWLNCACLSLCCWSFEETCSEYGHYITSIGGHEESSADNIYWLLYILSEKPDVADPPSNKQLSLVGEC